MQSKLHSLKLKKSILFDQMTMLSEISDSFYIQLGKVEAEILLLEKQIIRSTENDIQTS
jgi:hypothetical protein